MKIKKIAVVAMASVIGVTSFSFGAGLFQNKKVSYAINMVANGSPYIVQNQALKPFATDDGYTYLSVRSLSELGLVDIDWNGPTKTVTVSAKQTEDPVQVAQLNQRIAQLTNENILLKKENEELKAKTSSGKSSDSSNKKNKKSSGNELLKDMSSSDRRSLERDISSDLKNVKISTREYSNRLTFDPDVRISGNRVKLTLTAREKLDAGEWNDIIKGRRGSYLEEEFSDEAKDNVISVVKDLLKNYYDYEIEVSFQASKTDSNKDMKEIATANYRESSDRYKCYISKY